MAETAIGPELIDATIRFHGHNCPGVSIGIRVSELVLRDFERAPDEEIVAVVETDMCAVDAVQYLTGCTFGKGNLIHLDYGKNAFSFYRRSDGKGIRIVTRPEVFSDQDDGLILLQKKQMMGGRLSPEEERRLREARELRIGRIMEANLEDLFDVGPAPGPVPERARILDGLVCEECGERAMESRTRRLYGKVLCIPCFERKERRL